ncbi:phospholipase A and acyltransferase 3-like isoform X2 [Crassostrea virginica]
MDITQNNRSVIAKGKPGDLLEIDRGLYRHWAVYIGNDEVVHVSGGFKSRQKEASIKKENVWKVIRDSRVQVNNNKDWMLTPRSAAEIVSVALSKLGKIQYDLLFLNCEHFANWCRYGVKYCGQFTPHLNMLVEFPGTLIQKNEQQ